MRVLSRWVVATCHLPRNLAHARLSFPNRDHLLGGGLYITSVFCVLHHGEWLRSERVVFWRDVWTD